MKKLILIILLTLSSFASAQDIRTNPVIWGISDDLSTVEIQGSYERISKDPVTTIPAVNSCIIECTKKDNKCHEYIAKYVQPSDLSNAAGRYYLWLMKQEFSVLSWADGGEIMAQAGTRALDLTLIIDLSDRKVTRISQETHLGGAVGPKDKPDMWTIEIKQSDIEFNRNLLELMDLFP
jgi:hypothetical protein